MEKQIFRKKSLERISSPGEMREYLHISSPRLWMILSVILALLIGFIIYASIVTIENSVAAEAQVLTFTDAKKPFSTITVEIPSAVGDSVQIGMEARVDEQEAVVSSLYEEEGITTVILELNDTSILLKSGTYPAVIILERISPIRFLMN